MSKWRHCHVLFFFISLWNDSLSTMETSYRSFEEESGGAAFSADSPSRQNSESSREDSVASSEGNGDDNYFFRTLLISVSRNQGSSDEEMKSRLNRLPAARNRMAALGICAGVFIVGLVLVVLFLYNNL